MGDTSVDNSSCSVCIRNARKEISQPRLELYYNDYEAKKNVDVKGLSNFASLKLRDCCAYDCVIFRSCKVSKRKSGVSCVDNAYTAIIGSIYGGKRRRYDETVNE